MGDEDHLNSCDTGRTRWSQETQEVVSTGLGDSQDKEESWLGCPLLWTEARPVLVRLLIAMTNA